MAGIDNLSGKILTSRLGQPLLKSLAEFMLNKFGDNPLDLSSALVLLPTNRAVRALKEKFVELSGGKALMLPMIKSVGDIADDTFFTYAQEEKVIDRDERRLALTALISDKAKECGLQKPSPDIALGLADNLAGLMDSADFYEIDWDKLNDFVPLDYAEHWQKNLEFLQVIISSFPEFLKKEGKVNVAEGQISALRRKIKFWQDNPLQNMVIAAGIAGMFPSTAELLLCVAKMPKGMVIFRSLDKELPDDVWDNLDETHPQYQLKHLLGKMGIERSQVGWFGDDFAFDKVLSSRADFIRKAMYPATSSDKWQYEKGNISLDSLKGVYRINAKNETEEALAAALIFRQVLETEGKTALLICPDSAFAKRVSFELQRYGLDLEDSGGRMLADTPVGVFLNLLAQAAADKFSLRSLLPLLKHPLAAGGMKPSDFRLKVRQWEKSKRETYAETLSCPVSDDFLEPLGVIFRSDEEVPFEDILREHLHLAERLASTDTEDGGLRLWQSDAGVAAAELMAKTAQYAGRYLGKINPLYYPDLFRQLLGGHLIRSNYKQHPRLDMLGVLEGRMQTADTVIIAGLNEGVYPKEAEFSPWLSYSMTKDMGLELPDEKTGLEALDFMEQFMTPEVYLLRSNKKDGAGTVPSRWLLRMDSFASVVWGESEDFKGFNDNGFESYISGFDTPTYNEIKPISPPEPRPPACLRPMELSVTEVEKFMRDPYSIYAKHILKLSPLEDIDKKPGYNEYGTVVHSVFENFVRKNETRVPANALEQMKTLGEAAFKKSGIDGAALAFWWPEFLRVAEWFLKKQRELSPVLAKIVAEEKRKIKIPLSVGDFTLTGKIDRMDILKDGTCHLIDYKTGTVPSQKQVNNHLAPQLPLEAAMIRKGAFEDKGVKADIPVESWEFWKISGKASGSYVAQVCDNAEKSVKLSDEVYNGFISWLEEYAKEETPYYAAPRANYMLKYSDYEHLERIKEWKIVDDDTDEAEDGNDD